MQAYLAAIGLFEFCCMYIYFPETSQPGTRGVDKLFVSDGIKHRPRFTSIIPLQPNLLLIVSYQFYMWPCKSLSYLAVNNSV